MSRRWPTRTVSLAGICADVVDAGAVAVGDQLAVVENDPRSVGAEIAERLGGE